MKIVVIGGSGLIGKKLVTRLHERGHEAVAASPDSGVKPLRVRDWLMCWWMLRLLSM
jgi:uncharacterized protein YbjT (DUF2867 family)